MKSIDCYGLDDFEKLARDKATELSEFIGEELQLHWPPNWPSWPLRDWEIEWFMRAYVEYSLFRLEPHVGGPTKNWPRDKRPHGCPCVRFAGKLMALKKDGKPYTHEFLRCWERTEASLYKAEDIIQMCVAGKLVGVYGHL